MKKLVNIHALPTEKAVQFGLMFEVQRKYWRINNDHSGYQYNPEILKPHHLYFTSDEELRVGDYGINIYNNTNTIFKITKVFSDGYEGQMLDDSWAHYGLYKTLRKIVATTNPDLCAQDDEYTTAKNLPRIGTDFIKDFCKVQGAITEVMLEYQQYDVRGRLTDEEDIDNLVGSYLKVNPDGTVIWTLPETAFERFYNRARSLLYTREEVMRIADIYHRSFNYNPTIKERKEWFDRNYPV